MNFDAFTIFDCDIPKSKILRTSKTISFRRSYFINFLVITMIKVDKELCKGCNICTEFCPFKVYEQSKKPNKKGVRLPTPKHEERCTKCGLCALMCPDQAIRVEDKEE